MTKALAAELQKAERELAAMEQESLTMGWANSDDLSLDFTDIRSALCRASQALSQPVGVVITDEMVESAAKAMWVCDTADGMFEDKDGRDLPKPAWADMPDWHSRFLAMARAALTAALQDKGVG